MRGSRRRASCTRTWLLLTLRCWESRGHGSSAAPKDPGAGPGSSLGGKRKKRTLGAGRERFHGGLETMAPPMETDPRTPPPLLLRRPDHSRDGSGSSGAGGFPPKRSTAVEVERTASSLRRRSSRRTEWVGRRNIKKKSVGEEEKRVYCWGRSLCGTRAVVNIGCGVEGRLGRC